MRGKSFKHKKKIAKHKQKKHKHILVPCQIYQDSRHLVQNPKVANIMGFINRALWFTGPNYLDVDNPLQRRPSQQNNLWRNPLKKFHPKTPDECVDKEENTATAQKAIVEPKLKAAHLKIIALNVGTVTDH